MAHKNTRGISSRINKNPLYSWFSGVSSKKSIPALVLIAVIAVIGSHILFSGYAASPYSSALASSGTLTGDAVSNSDTTASSGKKVLFGAATGSGGYVTASGTNLMLNGKVFQFIGFNAYGMEGCFNGTPWTTAQLDAYFAGLPPNGMTRLWALQGYGVATITNIVAQASKYNQHLILSIGNDDGNCDRTIDDPNETGEPLSFYQGGWQSQYLGWVDTIVPMFANNPTVAMWEIANEPGQATAVPEATLQTYFNGTAAAIKAVGPHQLVESGVNVAGNMNNKGLGTEADYQAAQSSPDINVISFHDYSWSNEIGAVVSANFAVAQEAAAALNKPFIAGEAGVPSCSPATGTDSQNGKPWLSYSQRATFLLQKTNDYLGSSTSGPSASGIMFWEYEPIASYGTGCGSNSFEFYPGDSMITTVQNYVVP